MNIQKGSAKVTLLVVLVIVLAGVLVYFVFLKKPSEVAISPTPTATKTATPIPTVETASWKIYKNTDYGFQLTFTDAWTGYKVYGEQLINASGSTYIFAVPTKDKTFSDIGVPAGYFRAFILTLLDKHADKPWDENGPHPKYLTSNQTMDFYVSYPQEIPNDAMGKIKAGDVVATLKIL